MDIVSPRPLRIWANGTLVVDENLYWRLYQREVRAALVFPCNAGEIKFLVEVGPRPKYPEELDETCPSRNRKLVMKEIERIHPDQLKVLLRVDKDVAGPALSLRFPATQFIRDGVVFQHVLVHPIPGMSAHMPSVEVWSQAELSDGRILLTSSVLPGRAEEGTPCEELALGLRRFHVPVANSDDMPAALRSTGYDSRVEPVLEVVRIVKLSVEGTDGTVEVNMPAYESLGRQAPRREFKESQWPTFSDARSQFPEPVLPNRLNHFKKTYYAAWEMLLRLVRHPRRETGLPGSYISTGAGFKHHQFVWDSSFTAMCTAYGCRVLPFCATLDMIYSRQFDGGYINREHDVRDGMPAAYEPDFSPNPPIMSLAEWAIAGLSGDLLRLQRVYPVLRDYHKWIENNRKLPDGTYWTTGLANGLDNSPSLGDGYPDLTAQMAHDAETLGKIAAVLGYEADAKAWQQEHAQIGRALNERLWSEEMQIYSTSLLNGGHNPNKVVTAFWPLWAGIVPQDRVEALARHLKDPKSFWRHHPIPSLAADSPHFVPGGNYWVGSTWPPTNYAAIKGFDRAGRHDLAFEATLRHLECVTEVLNSSGKIWENYCSEASTNGSSSGADYCWSALGPIALLIEVIIGIDADALRRTVRWNPPDEDSIGIRNLPLGAGTVSLVSRKDPDGRWIEVNTDYTFRLELLRQGKWHSRVFNTGHTRLRFEEV